MCWLSRESIKQGEDLLFKRAPRRPRINPTLEYMDYVVNELNPVSIEESHGIRVETYLAPENRIPALLLVQAG